MEMTLDTGSVADYKLFLNAKTLPQFRCHGNTIYVPDEYAHLVLGKAIKGPEDASYAPSSFLFDYQRDIARMAIRKKKFGVFADPGLGKTLIAGEFAKHLLGVLPESKRILMLSPLMVVRQTAGEYAKFYGDSLPVEQVTTKTFDAWSHGQGKRIGIANFEVLNKEPERGNIGAIIVDEMLKDSCGKWIKQIMRIGSGLEWKLVMTGTPAPNDRIEYATHAVFLDAFPTINSFLARYFVNKAKTGARWILKPHAVEAFYRDLSHWCIFLTNPATYGWKDNVESIPPINIHIHNVETTQEQHDAVFALTGKLFIEGVGTISNQSKIARIGKGHFDGKKIATNKYDFIKGLVDSWPEESTLIWAWHNDEQDDLEKLFPDGASIAGNTKYEKRIELLDDFKSGKRKEMISKSQCLGFGLNLQVATRMIFSGLGTSYEKFFQCVKRANRVGSTRPLNVHIPVSEIERPQVEVVLQKAKRIQEDMQIQEQLFKNNMIEG